MRGAAARSPTTRKIKDLESRIERLQKFVEWGQVKKLDLAEIAPEELWQKHWANLREFDEFAKRAQVTSTKLREALLAAYKDRKDKKI